MNIELEQVNPDKIIDIDIANIIIIFYKRLVTRKNNANIVSIYNELLISAKNSLDNIAISCDNIEQAKQISIIANRLQLHWHNGERYINNTKFNKHIKNFCYMFWTGCYGSIDDIPDSIVCTNHSAQWFINNYKPIAEAVLIKIKL